MNTNPLPLQKSELPLDAGMLDGLSDPVFLVDPSHVIVDYNRAAKQLLGEDALSVRLDELLDSKDIIRTVRGAGYALDQNKI